MEVFLFLCAPVLFMKSVALPLLCCQFQSSRRSYLFSCTHILLAVGERVDAGQFISVLTVRLQGALRLHQFTQQIGTPQSLLLDLAHVSPLYFNNKSVRLTRNSVLWLAIFKNSLLRSQVKRVKMGLLPQIY